MRRFAGSLSRVLALSAGLAAFAGGPADAVDLLFLPKVDGEFAAGRVDQAFKLLEDAVRDPGTSPQERIDLLVELASRRLKHGDYGDAGEAFAAEAQVVMRQKGASAPELGAINAAAADAYLSAGNGQQALDLAQAALRIDRLYLDCKSSATAADYTRLARAYDLLGRHDQAQSQSYLAASEPARCAASASVGARNVVVTTDLSDATAGSFTRVKVFYATDRAATGSDRPEEFFGGDRGALSFGTVEVTVPREHKPGAIEAPSLLKLEWSANADRHFVVSRIETMDEDALFADMRSTLAEHKSDSAFVFIHGYNVSFADAAKRTAQIAYDLNFDGAPILYSWPSRANGLSYIADEAAVRLSGRHLIGFLEALTAEKGIKHLYLIAHSMGNRALLDALELIATRRNADPVRPPLFDQVIFAAPDEDAALFGEMVKTIRPLAERLTLYASENDVALLTSRQVHGDQPRAGQAGAAMVVADGLDSIDMSVVGADMLGHSYFAASASALTDILWLFWRNSPPPERCGMESAAIGAGKYWQFDPTRCDGPVMLSALTLLKAEGAAALGKLDTILARLSADPDKRREAAEWNAIRKVMSEAMAAP